MPIVDDLRLSFADADSMFHGPTSAVHPFVIACKGCRQNIPARVGTMPSSCITAKCPLCGEHRGYLPSEIFKGRVFHDLLRKPVQSAGWAVTMPKRRTDPASFDLTHRGLPVAIRFTG